MLSNCLTFARGGSLLVDAIKREREYCLFYYLLDSQSSHFIAITIQSYPRIQNTEYYNSRSPLVAACRRCLHILAVLSLQCSVSSSCVCPDRDRVVNWQRFGLFLSCHLLRHLVCLLRSFLLFSHPINQLSALYFHLVSPIHFASFSDRLYICHLSCFSFCCQRSHIRRVVVLSSLFAYANR